MDEAFSRIRSTIGSISPSVPDAEEHEPKIHEAQAELRQAVAKSHLLKERRRSHGEEWLANRIKVHVNITNPADWSFRSQQVIPVRASRTT